MWTKCGKQTGIWKTCQTLVCIPLFLGNPARICLLCLCSLSSTCELPTYPLKSMTPIPPFLSTEWQISLNCPVCPRVWYSFGTSICLYIINLVLFPVNLSHINLIIPARRTMREHRNTFALSIEVKDK